jgi:hypothetical protein
MTERLLAATLPSSDPARQRPSALADRAFERDA